MVDELCLIPEEVPNYEAIKSLHSQLDDDHSGDIDLAESVDVSVGDGGRGGGGGGRWWLWLWVWAYVDHIFIN